MSSSADCVQSECVTRFVVLMSPSAPSPFTCFRKSLSFKSGYDLLSLSALWFIKTRSCSVSVLSLILNTTENTGNTMTLKSERDYSPLCLSLSLFLSLAVRYLYQSSYLTDCHGSWLLLQRNSSQYQTTGKRCLKWQLGRLQPGALGVQRTQSAEGHQSSELKLHNQSLC